MALRPWITRALIALGALALVALAAGSWILVDDPGAWYQGSYLAPGVHLRRPFVSYDRYPAAPEPLSVTRPLATAEGMSREVTISLDYRWSARRLAAAPVAPDAIETRLAALIGELDARLPVASLGAALEEALPGLLDRLPIRVLDAEIGYPERPFEPLIAADRPTGERLVVMAMDGLDWVLLDRLIAAGRCPNLARLKREGAWGEILSHQPVLSPLIWTTIATGRPPETHGVLDFVASDPESGEDVPITNQFRRVHAVWNVLSYVGRRVHVVNWWASYPAEDINGTMVSERVFYQLFGIRPPLDDPANMHPPEALDELLPLLVEAEEVSFEEVRRYADVSRAEFDQAVAEAAAAENPFDDRLNHLRKILAVTAGVFNVGERLLEEEPADLTALYIEGTDTIGHRFAHYLPPRLEWVDGAEFERYRETMGRYYELCDRRLGELMDRAPADTTWIVVADHGFYTGRARPRVAPDDFTVGAPQWHRMVGAFLAAGPNVRRGRIPHLDIHDLARTLLWVLGAPISRQLVGREATELMSEEWAAAHPPVYVESYETLPRTWISEAARASAGDSEQARIQELRALGYLSSSSGAETGPAASAPPSTGLVTKPSEVYNRGKLAARRGDLEAAERHYREAIEADPGFGIAMASLAATLTERGRHDEALRWYLRAVESGAETLPPTVLVDLVLAAEAAGRLERILGALELLRDRWGEHSSFDTARGLAWSRLGRLEDAVAAYTEALARDPADAVATDELLALAALGHDLPVDEILERHLQTVSFDLKRLNDLGVICLRRGRPEWAERALAAVLESDPANAGVLGNLAVALQMQGETAEATAMLERAVAARPEDGGLRFNYGAALAAQGRSGEALAELDRAERLGVTGPRLFTARAKVLFRLGRTAEARATLERGAAHHPGDAEIRELLELLERGG